MKIVKYIFLPIFLFFPTCWAQSFFGFPSK